MGVLFPVTSLSANKLRAAKLFIRESARASFISQRALSFDGKLERVSEMAPLKGLIISTSVKENAVTQRREKRATQHVN
jgi:hypothetical protein